MEKFALTVETLAAIILVAVIVNSMSRRARLVAFLAVIVIVSLIVLTLRLAVARDLGQWNDGDPSIRDWYAHLMQPDNPAVSCCGEADAYWADSFEVSKNGEYVAIVTDQRPDGPLKRPHIEVGTKIAIPNNKLKYDQSNPTGHGIVFLSQSGWVYCYVAPGGV